MLFTQEQPVHPVVEVEVWKLLKRSPIIALFKTLHKSLQNKLSLLSSCSWFSGSKLLFSTKSVFFLLKRMQIFQFSYVNISLKSKIWKCPTVLCANNDWNVKKCCIHDAQLEAISHTGFLTHLLQSIINPRNEKGTWVTERSIIHSFILSSKSMYGLWETDTLALARCGHFPIASLPV